MKMFPNLPSIYDEDDFVVNKAFSNLDWSKNYLLHEIDFILAFCAGLYNDEKIELQKQVDSYIQKNSIETFM